jgi:glycine/D-amino acid oxidase-like deaminating enzyme
MDKLNRRSVLKSLGTITLGASIPNMVKAERLVHPYKTVEQNLTVDILVVGGGTAGTIAAIQAGRAGARTMLIESGSQLGGTTTTGGVAFPGIFHAWGKQIISGIGWELVLEAVELNGDKLPNFSVIPDRHWKHQVSVNPALYAMLAEEKCLEAGVSIRYYETPTRVGFNNGNWLVESVGKGIKTQITCNQLIDCSGNALVASMAGCDVLREEHTQPGSLVFSMDGYDFESLDLSKIPNKYHGTLRQNRLESQIRTSGENTFVPYGYVYVNGADSTTAETHTIANQQGRKNLLELIRELKKLPGCENIRIRDMKTETAVRETFRVDGLYKITHEDYVTGRVFDDALSYSFYPVDLHRDGKSIYQEFLKPDLVATIPMRALIPKKSSNLMVAGRCVSSDRLANSGLRVQASCMGMGQAAAATAFLAFKKNTTPASVPVNEVKNLLKEHGAIVPVQA